MNVAPHLSGYPSPYPLLLYEDALLYLLARVLRLPFPGLRGQVEHQPVDRAAELRAAPHRQADDLAYALERVRDPVFTPEAESLVDPAGLLISVRRRGRCLGVRRRGACSPRSQPQTPARPLPC